MKILANSVRAGNILVYKNQLYRVSKSPEHTKPGKGPAYIQIEMKPVVGGNKLNERFNSSDYIETAQLEQQDFRYLYSEGSDMVLMNMENFEQIIISKNILGDKSYFLKDNMDIKVSFHGNNPINIELPTTIVDEIIETDPVIKGATVTSSFKPAKLACGIVVKVPSYLTTGEIIVVKTEDSSYVERAK
ncbi:MAG: elongation factor P [Rickettsiaceae bacterium]|nr:MAG: elongation factor P [Rickettsiaceae bacterium]